MLYPCSDAELGRRADRRAGWPQEGPNKRGNNPMTVEILYLTTQIQSWLNVRLPIISRPRRQMSPVKRLIVRRPARGNGARMNEAVVLTPERILEATEDVLRRYRARQGDRRGCCPCARCEPRQRLPSFSEQGVAARGGGQALARSRQCAAAEGRGRAPGPRRRGSSSGCAP